MSDRAVWFIVVACAVVAGCSSSDDPPKQAVHEIDPRQCPPAPGPGAAEACSDEGALCHYSESCSSNCRCTDGVWACGELSRFSCGDCASDVRCSPGEQCGGGQELCACGADGVFGCAQGGAAPGALPACPLVVPEADACTAEGQRCHYWSYDEPCKVTCTCNDGRFFCSESCGA